MINQDRAFWTNHTARTRSPHLHENGPIRDQGWGLVSINVSSAESREQVSPGPSGSLACDAAALGHLGHLSAVLLFRPSPNWCFL